MFDKQLCCITKSVQGCWDYWPPLAPVKTRNPGVWRIRHRLSISKLWRLPLWLFLVTQNLIHLQTYRRTGSPEQLFRCCDYCERLTPSSGFRSSETLYHWRCYLKNVCGKFLDFHRLLEALLADIGFVVCQQNELQWGRIQIWREDQRPIQCGNGKRILPQTQR